MAGLSGSSTPRKDRELKYVESSTSEISGSSTASSDGDPSSQMLRLETITDNEARVVTASIKVIAGLCLAAIVALAVLKTSAAASELFVLNHGYHAGSLAVGAAAVVSLMASAVFYAARILASVRAGRHWSRRRRHAVVIWSTRGAIMLVVTGAYTAVHAIVLADPDALCTARAVAWLSTVPWIGWNCMLLMIVVDAHALVPLRGAGGRMDGAVRDLGPLRHWKKLFLWAPFTGVTIWLAVLGQRDGHLVTVVNPQSCAWGDKLECAVPPTVVAGSVLMVASVFAYAALFVRYMFVAWRALHGELYQRFRLWNILWQLEFRASGTALLIFLIGTSVLWCLGATACVNYVTTWLGITPVVVSMTGFQLIGFYLTTPRPQSHIEDVIGSIWLMQRFAWTERSMPHKLAERAAAAREMSLGAVPGAAEIPPIDPSKRAGQGSGGKAGTPPAQGTDATGPGAQPMFCFELCIKLFFWAALIYSYTEAEGSEFVALPEAIRVLVSDIGAAMRLFGLTRRRLFYDRSRGTKVLVAWNESTVLVTVRGSAEVANFYEDAKFLQVVHPPRRKGPGGRMPRVHRGFLATWTANGIGAAVLSHVCVLVNSAASPANIRILVTGHSLGGAVAQLAALDVARALRLQPRQLTVYTFGCPRIGNRALAAEYVAAVPDTWHVINNHDIVTQGMKFLGMYKRAGARVIVTDKGDLIVSPTLLEASLLQNPFGGSVAHHYTAAYHEAFLSIITAQLDASRSHTDGLEGLLALLKEVPSVGALLAERSASFRGKLTAAPSADEASPVVSEALRLSQGMSAEAASLTDLSTGAARLLQVAQADDAVAELLAEDTAVARDGAHWDEPAVARGDVTGGAPDGPPDVDREPIGTDGVQLAIKPGQSRGVCCYLEDTAAMAPDAPRSHGAHGRGWRTARSRVRGALAVSRLGADLEARRDEASRPVPPGMRGNGGCSVSLTLPEPPAARCYAIPEGAHEGAQAEEGELAGGAGGVEGCAEWRCPLTAPEEQLPGNALLHGCLLEIGAAPDMRSCHGLAQ